MKYMLILLAVIGLGLTGCSGDTGSNGSSGKESAEKFQVEFRKVSDTEQPGYLRMNLSGTARYYYVSNEVAIGSDAVARAELDTTRTDRPSITLILTDEGAGELAELTRTRVGKRIGIVADGLLVTAPLVMAEISSGRAVIDGHFDDLEVKRILRGINGP